MNSLLDFYSDEGPERCGLIMSNGDIVELINAAEDPLEAFEISGADLIKYEDVAIASWHTHPGQSSQLSLDDYAGFLNYPNFQHHIVGKNGVTSYAVINKRIVIGD